MTADTFQEPPPRLNTLIKEAAMAKKPLAAILILMFGCSISVSAQDLPPAADLHLMEIAMEAMVNHDRIHRFARPVVADTFGFGMPVRSGPAWRAQGGPQWMQVIARRLGVPLGGSADPGDQVLLSVLPPRPHALGADTVRIPARASVRTRHLDTGELVDNTAVHHWDVVLVNDAGDWRVDEIVFTAIAGRTRIVDRERWAEGLPPRKPRPDRP